MYKSICSIYYAKLSKNFSYYISLLLIVVKYFSVRFFQEELHSRLQEYAAVASIF